MRMFRLLSAVSCLLSAAVAVQPGFDAREVVRQVRDAARPASGVECPACDDGEFLIDTTGVHAEYKPAVTFDGTDFLAVWQDERNNPDAPDVYGAFLIPAGAVRDEFPVVAQEGRQGSSALCRGGAGQPFLVYQGWAGTVGGKTYSTTRIWGKMNPVPGIEESPKPQACWTRQGGRSWPLCRARMMSGIWPQACTLCGRAKRKPKPKRSERSL